MVARKAGTGLVLGELERVSVPFDLGTPTSLFLRLQEEEGAFLLESVEGGQSLGRYSFLGCEPLVTAVADMDGWSVETPDGRSERRGPGLGELRPLLDACKHDVRGDLPPLAAGLVGYVGYDMVRAHERLGRPPTDDLGLPVAHLIYPGTLYALDHATNTLHVVVRGDAGHTATSRLQRALERLGAPSEPPMGSRAGLPLSPPEAQANLDESQYRSMVLRAKEHIRAGDIFQVVLSQRLSRPLRARPFEVYRALRRLNPSPYMFHLRCRGDVTLVGASPEMFVRLRDGVAEQRPLAGTRRRGATRPLDQALAQELLGDEKERAEHVMLVDLARNDLGRVSRYGTVRVPELMEIERFSHVMHLVSHVRGELSDGRDAVDLLAACLPAGTVSGAPKVRAMQIIDELEPTRRGPYAGAVGYLDSSGNLDTCITIRTIVATGGRAYVQAGAGIVADSDPAREYQETLSKAAALLSALDRVEQGQKEAE